MVTALLMSEEFESDRDAKGVSESPKIAAVVGHHQIPPSSRADHHRSIHDIRGTGDSTGRTGRPSPSLIELLDTAAGQQPRQLRLRPTSPTLTQHTSRHRRHDASLDRPALQRPHTTIAALGRDQRSRVIRDARHRSGRHPVAAPVDDRIRPHQLLVGELTVVSLPCPNPGQTVLEDQRPLSRRVQPRRQTQTMASGSASRLLRYGLIQRNRQLPHSHDGHGSTAFLPTRVDEPESQRLRRDRPRNPGLVATWPNQALSTPRPLNRGDSPTSTRTSTRRRRLVDSCPVMRSRRFEAEYSGRRPARRRY